MEALSKLVREGGVNHSVPLDRRLPLECVRNNINREMSLSATTALRSHWGMMPMLPGVVGDHELGGTQEGRDPEEYATPL